MSFVDRALTIGRTLQNTVDRPEFKQLVDLVRDAPRVKPDDARPGQGRCACKKLVEVTNFEIRNSGLVTFVDDVCPGCRKYSNKLTTLICVVCKQVVGRTEPSTDKHGFKFRPGAILHVDKCPSCVIGLQAGKEGAVALESKIIEQVIYWNKIGRKT